VNGSVQVTQAIVPALPLSYSPVVGEIGVEPITWRISGVYAHAVGVRFHSMVDPAGFEPAASAMPSRRAPGCATGPSVGDGYVRVMRAVFPLAEAHQDSNLATTRQRRVALPTELCVCPRGRGTPPSTGAARRPRTGSHLFTKQMHVHLCLSGSADAGGIENALSIVPLPI
jgi:hypothetical protein